MDDWNERKKNRICEKNPSERIVVIRVNLLGNARFWIDCCVKDIDLTPHCSGQKLCVQLYTVPLQVPKVLLIL